MPSRSVTISTIVYAVGMAQHFKSTLSVQRAHTSAQSHGDLGNQLGIPAHLSNLVRTRSGPFSLQDSWTIPELRELDAAVEWETIAEHPDMAIQEWPAIVLSEKQSIDWAFGRSVELEVFSEERLARVYDSAGHWRGIARQETGTTWSPARVIATP